jgi:D-3-phosphoglycerate dehydrogenase / 2-oxoglutarate reductase
MRKTKTSYKCIQYLEFTLNLHMRYTIYRVNKSQYQDNKFILAEKKALELNPSLSYTNSVTEVMGDGEIILLTNSQTKIREIPAIILKKTALMIHPNSGWDNIDPDFIRDYKFPILVGNTIRANAVAEYILSCLFKHFTPIHSQHHWDNERKWDRQLIRDQKIVIFGHGHIGKLVFNALSPLCPKIYVIDPHEFSESSSNRLTSLPKDFLNDTDVVIPCTDLNRDTRHLINNSFLNEFNNPFIIINASRGQIINQDTLVQRLKKEYKSKVYLDVFETEPFRPGEFMGIENIHKTSHIAGVFENLNKDIISFERLIIEDFIHSKTVSNELQFLTKYKNQDITNRF